MGVPVPIGTGESTPATGPRMPVESPKGHWVDQRCLKPPKSLRRDVHTPPYPSSFVSQTHRGHPIHLVREAMGHSTVRVTEGYLHLVATDLLRLVEEPTQEALKEMVK